LPAQSAYRPSRRTPRGGSDALGRFPPERECQGSPGQGRAVAWGSQAKLKFLEEGDVDATLQTASAIGDDTLQRRSQGYVVPDAFTHGSSAQRKRRFAAGLRSGRIESCDTFSAARP
jgi:hypothetical protein